MSKGNMYTWAKPWNPLGGKCPHDCSYCSTNKLRRYPVIADKYSGKPRLCDNWFKLPKQPKTIFVAAQNDLFSEDVSFSLIMQIINNCKNHPQHEYLFQTKNPRRFLSFADVFPRNTILCTTIETNRWYPDIMRNCPHPELRSAAMNRIIAFEKQVTIEPVMDFDLDEMVSMIKFCGPSKVNIGADSKNNHLPEPSKKKLLALINELQKFTIIDRKSNLERLLK
jgi:protein gp37